MEKKQYLAIEASNVLWISPFLIFFGSGGSSIMVFRLMSLLRQHRDQDNTYYILSIINFSVVIFLMFISLVSFIIGVHILVSSSISLISLLFLRILAFTIVLISTFVLISLIIILVSLMKENFFRPLVNETLANIILYSLILAIFSIPYLIILLKIKSKQETSMRELKSIYS